MTSTNLNNIRLLLLDVDGVLTDGAIIYDDKGVQTKVFDSRDGMGMRLLVDAGIQVGIVTGRQSGALSHRCANLGIDLVFEGVSDKAAVLTTVCDRTGIAAEHIAFMGNDLPDLPLMHRVGLAVAVADAHEIVIARSDVVTEAGGGRGAVREVCEMILKSQGLWEAALNRFME